MFEYIIKLVLYKGGISLKYINIIKKTMIIILAVSLAIAAAACKNEPDDPHFNIIYYNIDNEPVTLDPQIANDAGARLVILNIFEGLVRLDKNNDPAPGAAMSWDISTDKMMYTFTLRNNLKWNDGSELTAEDFVYGIKRSLSPETASPTASTLFAIKNAEKFNNGEASEDALGIFSIGNNKLMIQLEYPDSDFLSVLATPPAMPCSEKFFKSSTGQYGRRDDKIISNGAFYVRENGWEHGEYIYIRRNEQYTGENEVIPAGVNITIGKNYDNVCAAVASGTIDCGSISSSETELAKSSGLWLTSFGDTIWGLSFNTQKDPMKSLKLRQALLSSLDRNYILKTIPDGCNKTEYIIPSSAETDGKKYRTLAGDIKFVPSDEPGKLLKEALTEAGLASVPAITILCPNDEASQSIVNNTIETWNKLTNGYFNKEPVSMSELRDRITDGNFEAAIAPLTIQGETPLSTLEMFDSSSDYNAAALHDSNYDKRIVQVRKNLSSDNVGAAVEAEKYLCDNAVFFPLYTENRFYASASNVENIIFHPYGAEADFISAKKILDD